MKTTPPTLLLMPFKLKSNKLMKLKPMPKEPMQLFKVKPKIREKINQESKEEKDVVKAEETESPENLRNIRKMNNLNKKEVKRELPDPLAQTTDRIAKPVKPLITMDGMLSASHLPTMKVETVLTATRKVPSIRKTKLTEEKENLTTPTKRDPTTRKDRTVNMFARIRLPELTNRLHQQSLSRLLLKTEWNRND